MIWANTQLPKDRPKNIMTAIKNTHTSTSERVIPVAIPRSLLNVRRTGIFSSILIAVIRTSSAIPSKTNRPANEPALIARVDRYPDI